MAMKVLRILIFAGVIWGMTRATQKAFKQLQLQQQSLDVEQAKLKVKLEASNEPSEKSEIAAQIHHLEAQRFHFSQVRSPWLVLSGVFYALGMVPSWWYWHNTLQAMGQQPSWFRSCRAFFIGHLGKYVPGKALVVILRARYVSDEKVDATVAGVAVFVETLTLMAVGAMVASAILLFYLEHWQLLVLAIGLMICSAVPTFPPLFRRVVGIVKNKSGNSELQKAIDGISYSLMARGWLAISVAWVLFGLSLWAAMRAIPTVHEVPWNAFPLLVATVSLAMVAGFLSLLPGGAGVRELVVSSLLTPQFGMVIALSAAVILRLVWLVSEVVISIILYPMGNTPPKE
ncbi:MAG: uncharacterized membrane protein YbhN (UPF0104 family) [Pirellulaceae bacterium]|jgi:uncharacterized membrane protein YbhN (UPF0104 family)